LPSSGSRLSGLIRRAQTRRRHRGDTLQLTIVIALAATLAVPVGAQQFLAEPGAPAAAFPKPDRPIANIISPIWHDERERDAAGEPGQLVRLLGITSGMTVADIGAGSGYYVVRLSPIVGTGGRIIAEDVVPEYLQSLSRRVRERGLQNVIISRGEPHDPRLPANSLDIAIWCICITRSPSLTVYSTISFRRLSPTRGWHCRRLYADGRTWNTAGSFTLRARRRGISPDQLRSTCGQQRLSGDLCAADRCEPDGSASHGRVQGALAREPPRAAAADNRNDAR